SHTRKDMNMLSREDFYMIKQMRQQGAYIVDIAAQIGCSERTVRRYLKYPEPPARKTRHKMVKLKPFMDYIDMRLAENVWNSEVIFAEFKATGYTGGRSMMRYYITYTASQPGTHQKIIDMAMNGVGCRATARIMGVGLNTIFRHLKNSGRSR